MGLFRRRGAASAPREITVYTRDGCHLCHDALAIVDAVAVECGATVVAIDIDGDPELQHRWSDQVPVVLVEGQVIAVWRVDRQHLQAALTGDG